MPPKRKNPQEEKAINDLFEDFFKKKNQKDESKKTLSNLYKKPVKEKRKTMPTFQNPTPNTIHQTDLMTMPNDRGFKYMLVVIDNSSKKVDAVPLKGKSAETVLKGLKTIYEKRKILKKPKAIEIDAGSEFKSVVKNYFDDNDISFRVAKTGRHRQQALVERANQTIQSALFKRMSAEEILTGETVREWVDDLDKLIKVMNKYRNPYKLPDNIKQPSDENTKKLLQEGQSVRVALEEPTDAINGRRIGKKFRTGDLRWNVEPKKVKQIILKPNQPPLYLVSGKENERVAYTKNQLQPVPNNEKPPNKYLIKDLKNKRSFVVDKILESRIRNGRKQYKIKWLGFDENESTWENAEIIQEAVPKLVRKFERA